MKRKIILRSEELCKRAADVALEAHAVRVGTARMRVGGWFRGRWMFILDRDFTEPDYCQ